MNTQERFKEIENVAGDAISIVYAVTKGLGDNNIVIDELGELSYKLGYIKGLSYIVEVED